MAQLKLCFVLLLPLTVCADRKEELKTSGTEQVVIPLCNNSTLDMISLIVCKIRTERHNGEGCRLVFRYEEGFEHGCDSRFTLMRDNQSENQTVFLHLTSLRPADSGNYTCHCSQQSGQYTLYLNITVEENEDVDGSPRQMQIPVALLGVTIVIVITVATFGLIYARIRCGRRSPSTPLNMEPQDIEPYSTFIRRESGLYSTVRVHVSYTNANNSNMFTREDAHAGKFL